MLLVFIILAVTVVLLVWDRFPMELVALGAMLALAVSGSVTVPQALAGFSDSSVVSITALFVVGAGLFHTGVADWLAARLIRIGGDNPKRFLLVMCAFTAVSSAFLSNTGTIAVLLPAVISAAKRMKVPASRLLIPLAFSAQIGGMLTLVGTPPNIVLTEALREAGMRGFGFFEFAWLGVPLLLAYLLFLFLGGARLVPERKDAAADHEAGISYSELTDTYLLKGTFFELRVRNGSSLIGHARGNLHLTTHYHIHVLGILEPGDHILDPEDFEPRVLPTDLEQVIERDHVLVVQGDAEVVAQFAVECNLGVQPISAENNEGRSLFTREMGLAEVLITQRSSLAGVSIKDARFADAYGVQVLGVMRGGKPLPLPFHHEPLAFGDTLLVFGAWSDIRRMGNQIRDFIVSGEPDALGTDVRLRTKSWLAIAVVVAMVILMLVKVFPIVVVLLGAALAMVLLGCLTTEDAYRAISWQSVILIAAMVPMSTALQASGASDMIAGGLAGMFTGGQQWLLLGGFFLATAIFSQFISNTATTILIAPIALDASAQLGVAPHASLMAVAAGASSAFLTPVASPVNMLVLGPGHYRFTDFARAGAPLVLLVLAVCLLVIPLVW
jgi:di/tricarboxylate transporter